MTLSTPLQIRIRNQLQLRLHQGMRSGEKINEAELASRLGVSRTPVREVLKQLAEEGVLAYEQGRGFSFQRFDVAKRTADIGLEDLLDERVMRDMALGTLPSTMSERALMDRYGVSQGTLRSTLRRLMRDRLVEPSTGRGWIFTGVGPAALKESYRFRQIVEPAAILADGYRVDDSALQALDEEHAAAIAHIEEASRGTLFELDARFHEVVARGAGTAYLVDATARQNNIRRVNEYIGFIRPERLRLSMEEHRGIIAAMLSRNLQIAAALMRLHLQVSEAETFLHLDGDLDLVRAGRLMLTEHFPATTPEDGPQKASTGVKKKAVRR